MSTKDSATPRRNSWKEVVVGSTGFDIVSLAFLLGVTRAENVTIRTRATSAELLDPEILCLGAGRSSGFEKSNYDYGDYGSGGHGESLAKRVHETSRWEMSFWRTRRVSDDAGLGLTSEELRRRVARFVEYAYFIHELGEEAVGIRVGVYAQTLVGVFNQMMAHEKDPVEQFFKGIDILAEVVRKGLDPFGAIEV